MPQLPQYTQQAVLSAPTTGVYVQNQNAAFWDNISSWAYGIADKQMTELGAAQGVKDQQASGSADKNVSPDGILGQLSRVTSFGKGYANGADQIYAAQKQMVLGDKVAELQKQFPADPEGFRSAYDTAKKSWLSDVRPDLLPGFAKYADETGLRQVTILQQQGVERQKQEQAVSALASFDKLRTEIYDGILSGKVPQDQIDQKQAQAAAILEGAVKAGYISPVQARQHVEQASFNTKTAEILKQFRGNPSQDFVEAIKNSKEQFALGGGTPFTPEQRQQLGSKLDAELNQMISRARAAEASASAQAKAQFNDHIAQITTTGEGLLTDDQIKAAFAKNPVLQQEALAKTQIARDTFNFNQSIGLTSASEDRDRLNKMMPQAGDTAYADKLQAFGRAQSLVQNKWQQVESDSAQYVIANSPEIRTMISSPDEATRNQGFATMREIQTRMGISPGNQAVITNGDAKAIVKEIKSSDSPEKAADLIAATAAKYGDYYPSVAKQLAKEGLNPAYQVLASLTRPEDAETRVDLAKALSMGDAALKDNLDKRDKTMVLTIDQQTQAYLADFTRTAMAQGDPRLVKTVNDAATLLAYYYATVPGGSSSDAPRRAANALISRYDFIGDMRVPRGTGADVESATDSVRRSLTADILRPVPERPGETLTPEQRLGIQLDQAKRGRWVTNEDGSGAILLYPNGQPVMVRSTSTSAPATPVPGEPSQIDPKVDAKAIQKKTNVQGNDLNTQRVEAAQQSVQDRRDTGWRRVEVLFKDAKSLAPIRTVPGMAPDFGSDLQLIRPNDGVR